MVLSPRVSVPACQPRPLFRVPSTGTIVHGLSALIEARGEDGVCRENLHVWLPGDAELLDAGHEPATNEGVKRFAWLPDIGHAHAAVGDSNDVEHRPGRHVTLPVHVLAHLLV